MATHLQTGFDPVQLGQLEELSRRKCFEEVAFVLSLRPFVVQTVEYPAFEKLLVANSDFDGVALWAMFLEP